jgi:rhamnosyltransferase
VSLQLHPRDSVVGIVLYHPDEDAVALTLNRLAPSARALIAVANSSVSDSFRQRLEAAAGSTPLEIIKPVSNLGLGAAYNQLLQRAGGLGARYVLLLDQDSSPSSEMLPQLEQHMAGLMADGLKPAAVGPQPVEPGGRHLRLAVAQRVATPRDGVAPVTFIISSGSLVSVEETRRVGLFREDFFIDAVDLEWCMRAWAHGRTVWVATGVPMVHQLGRGVIQAPLGLRLADQPPARIYTYFRNQFAMLGLSHVPMHWKARFILSLPIRCVIYLIRHRFSLSVRRAIGLGILHGLRGQLGSPVPIWAKIGRP